MNPPLAALACATSLLDRHAAIRATTEALAAPLSPEDCALQSMPSASPVKWHLAHTTWFFETFVLEPFVHGWKPFHPAFRVLFNSYYQQVGERHPRPERGLLSRPPLDDVRAYRRHVDHAIGRLLARDARPEALARVELGLQHEQQHQELLLTDVKHLFSRNPMRPAYLPRTADQDSAASAHVDQLAAPLRWVRFEGGTHELGARGDGFVFDNESPRHRVQLVPFELGSRLVTNSEFLEFIVDGGYCRPELWLAEGWDAVQAERWTAPLYWERRDGEWWQFTLAGERALTRAEPVCHVSFFEADAFARWSGARLPTEFEWEVAAAGLPVSGSFLESRRLHPAPDAAPSTARADSRSPGATSDVTAAPEPTRIALRQMFGETWQWTNSAYAPYPGYRAPAGAIGEYNGKFMVNQQVLRGGSCVSPTSHLRASYRNFFHAHERWQFLGIRLARDARS